MKARPVDSQQISGRASRVVTVRGHHLTPHTNELRSNVPYTKTLAIVDTCRRDVKEARAAQQLKEPAARAPSPAVFPEWLLNQPEFQDLCSEKIQDVDKTRKLTEHYLSHLIGVDLDKYFKGPPLRKKSVPISTEQEPGKIPQRSTTTYGTTQVPDIASDEPRQPFKPADIFYKEAIEAHNKTFYGEKHNKKTGECDLDGVLLLDAERNLRAAFRLTADTFGLEDERSATAFSNLLRCYLAMGIAREGETEELINSPELHLKRLHAATPFSSDSTASGLVSPSPQVRTALQHAAALKPQAATDGDNYHDGAGFIGVVGAGGSTISRITHPQSEAGASLISENSYHRGEFLQGSPVRWGSSTPLLATATAFSSLDPQPGAQELVVCSKALQSLKLQLQPNEQSSSHPSAPRLAEASSTITTPCKLWLTAGEMRRYCVVHGAFADDAARLSMGCVVQAAALRRGESAGLGSVDEVGRNTLASQLSAHQSDASERGVSRLISHNTLTGEINHDSFASSLAISRSLPTLERHDHLTEYNLMKGFAASVEANNERAKTSPRAAMPARVLARPQSAVAFSSSNLCERPWFSTDRLGSVRTDEMRLSDRERASAAHDAVKELGHSTTRHRFQAAVAINASISDRFRRSGGAGSVRMALQGAKSCPEEQSTLITGPSAHDITRLRDLRPSSIQGEHEYSPTANPFKDFGDNNKDVGGPLRVRSTSIHSNRFRTDSNFDHNQGDEMEPCGRGTASNIACKVSLEEKGLVKLAPVVAEHACDKVIAQAASKMREQAEVMAAAAQEVVSAGGAAANAQLDALVAAAGHQSAVLQREAARHLAASDFYGAAAQCRAGLRLDGADPLLLSLFRASLGKIQAFPRLIDFYCDVSVQFPSGSSGNVIRMGEPFDIGYHYRHRRNAERKHSRLDWIGVFKLPDELHPREAEIEWTECGGIPSSDLMSDEENWAQENTARHDAFNRNRAKCRKEGEKSLQRAELIAWCTVPFENVGSVRCTQQISSPGLYAAAYFLGDSLISVARSKPLRPTFASAVLSAPAFVQCGEPVTVEYTLNYQSGLHGPRDWIGLFYDGVFDNTYSSVNRRNSCVMEPGQITPGVHFGHVEIKNDGSFPEVLARAELPPENSGRVSFQFVMNTPGAYRFHLFLDDFKNSSGVPVLAGRSDVVHAELEITGGWGNSQRSRQNREFRVYLSSSFGEMEEERHTFASAVAPKLYALCSSLEVNFNFIDLREGALSLSEVQSILLEPLSFGLIKPGATAPLQSSPAAPAQKIFSRASKIRRNALKFSAASSERFDHDEDGDDEECIMRECLFEVERCSPHFVGLLADRYDIIPRVSLPASVIRLFPWAISFSNPHIKIESGGAELGPTINRAGLCEYESLRSFFLPQKQIQVEHEWKSHEKMTSVADQNSSLPGSAGIIARGEDAEQDIFGALFYCRRNNGGGGWDSNSRRLARPGQVTELEAAHSRIAAQQGPWCVRGIRECRAAFENLRARIETAPDPTSIRGDSKCQTKFARSHYQGGIRNEYKSASELTVALIRDLSFRIKHIFPPARVPDPIDIYFLRQQRLAEELLRSFVPGLDSEVAYRFDLPSVAFAAAVDPPGSPHDNRTLTNSRQVVSVSALAVEAPSNPPALFKKDECISHLTGDPAKSQVPSTDSNKKPEAQVKAAGLSAIRSGGEYIPIKGKTNISADPNGVGWPGRKKVEDIEGASEFTDVGRTFYEIATDFVDNGNGCSPLMLVDDEGSGKSTLLMNWLRNYVEALVSDTKVSLVRGANSFLCYPRLPSYRRSTSPSTSHPDMLQGGDQMSKSHNLSWRSEEECFMTGCFLRRGQPHAFIALNLDVGPGLWRTSPAAVASLLIIQLRRLLGAFNINLNNRSQSSANGSEWVDNSSPPSSFLQGSSLQSRADNNCMSSGKEEQTLLSGDSQIGSELPLPGTSSGILAELSRILSVAAASRVRVLLVLDGLNRVKEDDEVGGGSISEDLLYWLPTRYDSQIRCIFSSTSTPQIMASLDSTCRNDWTLLRRRAALSLTSRQALVHAYLIGHKLALAPDLAYYEDRASSRAHGVPLLIGGADVRNGIITCSDSDSEAVLKDLWTHQSCANPLFLTIVVEDLTRCGVFAPVSHSRRAGLSFLLRSKLSGVKAVEESTPPPLLLSRPQLLSELLSMETIANLQSLAVRRLKLRSPIALRSLCYIHLCRGGLTDRELTGLHGGQSSSWIAPHSLRGDVQNSVLSQWAGLGNTSGVGGSKPSFAGLRPPPSWIAPEIPDFVAVNWSIAGNLLDTFVPSIEGRRMVVKQSLRHALKSYYVEESEFHVRCMVILEEFFSRHPLADRRAEEQPRLIMKMLPRAGPFTAPLPNSSAGVAISSAAAAAATASVAAANAVTVGGSLAASGADASFGKRDASTAALAAALRAVELKSRSSNSQAATASAAAASAAAIATATIEHGRKMVAAAPETRRLLERFIAVSSEPSIFTALRRKWSHAVGAGLVLRAAAKANMALADISATTLGTGGPDVSATGSGIGARTVKQVIAKNVGINHGTIVHMLCSRLSAVHGLPTATLKSYAFHEPICFVLAALSGGSAEFADTRRMALMHVTMIKQAKMENELQKQLQTQLKSGGKPNAAKTKVFAAMAKAAAAAAAAAADSGELDVKVEGLISWAGFSSAEECLSFGEALAIRISLVEDILAICDFAVEFELWTPAFALAESALLLLYAAPSFTPLQRVVQLRLFAQSSGSSKSGGQHLMLEPLPLRFFSSSGFNNSISSNTSTFRTGEPFVKAKVGPKAGKKVGAVRVTEASASLNTGEVWGGDTISGAEADAVNDVAAELAVCRALCLLLRCLRALVQPGLVSTASRRQRVIFGVVLDRAAINARLEVSTALLLRINLRLGLASAPAGATVIVDRPEIKLARVELQRLQDLLSCPKESRAVHLQSAVDWGGLEPEERAI